MSGNKGFFRIDKRLWAAVCELGMNPAVAYLALGCGTGGDNRTTAWSAKAVSEYAGIAWIRGKAAIKEIAKGGFIRRTKDGSRPRYELLDWSEFEQASPRPSMDGYTACVLRSIADGNQPKSKAQRTTAEGLVQARRLWLVDNKYVTQAPAEDGTTQWIWLPQTLVTGTSKGEDSPLARVRRLQDVLALRLFIDLYHVQHLCEHGGIDRAVLYQQYERAHVGEQGIYAVWAFTPGQAFACPHPVTSPHWHKLLDGESVLWKRLEQLRDAGLIEWMPHLFEGDKPDSEIIHAYGSDWTEEGLKNPENAVGRAAHLAGQAMGYKPDMSGDQYLAPITRGYPDVQMIGVARLRYRPHTGHTAQWWKLTQTRLPEFIKNYEGLRATAEVEHQGTHKVAGHVTHQGDIKELSKSLQ
jgi:hypothetical protein